RRLPARFHAPVARDYLARHAVDYRAANVHLRTVADYFAAPVDLSASDADIRAYAERCAAGPRARLMDLVTCTPEAVEARLARYAASWRVVLPKVKTLSGLVARLTCPIWWRRALRRAVGRTIERGAIAIGMVHARASLYASTE